MHHHKSVVEVAEEEEVEAVAVEAVVVEVEEAVAEAVAVEEEDHLVVNPLHKPLHLLRPRTTMAED